MTYEIKSQVIMGTRIETNEEKETNEWMNDLGVTKITDFQKRGWTTIKQCILKLQISMTYLLHKHTKVLIWENKETKTECFDVLLS